VDLISLKRFNFVSWLVEFKQDPTADILAYLDSLVVKFSHPLCEWTAGDCSLLLIFNQRVDEAFVRHLVSELCVSSHGSHGNNLESRLHLIQMKFDGPDLSRVADHLALSEKELIHAHCSVIHHVAFMGFAPGFAYLKGSKIAGLPRLKSPHPRIKPGSVAVAAGYCSVYPVATAGGWNLIGTSEQVFFNPQSDTPFLLRPFDRVCFEIC
jgi:KipI family sensor histidine kinase inhibitor